MTMLSSLTSEVNQPLDADDYSMRIGYLYRPTLYTPATQHWHFQVLAQLRL